MTTPQIDTLLELYDPHMPILNVAGASKTPDIVRKIRQEFPDVPIIATGGNEPELILKTIEAGANAITYTPPTPAVLFKSMMERYRE